MKKLVSFDDFDSNWKNIKENIEEIVPEGLPGLPENESNVIEEIKEFLENDPDDNIIEELVNQLRDALLEMEQQGFIDRDFTDELDDRHDGDWTSWILEVIELPDFPEEGINNIMELINGGDSSLEFGQEEDFEDEEGLEEDDFEDEEDDL